VLTRVIYGARISLAAGVVTVLLAGFIGAAIGLLSGYYGGWIDAVLMRPIPP
jgi:peptide/nickel transport system permease protein